MTAQTNTTARTTAEHTAVAKHSPAPAQAQAQRAPLPLRDLLRRFVAVKTLADVLDDAVKDARTTVTRALLDQYNEDDVKQTVVKIDGHKVATATVAEPKAETKVTDSEALLAWARENRPDLIETVEHPAQEAWTETRVKAPELTRLVEDSEDTGTGDLATGDGEIIPGVRHIAHPAPSRFSVNYARPAHSSDDPLAGGRRAVLDAFAQGRITVAEALNDLDEITGN